MILRLRTSIFLFSLIFIVSCSSTPTATSGNTKTNTRTSIITGDGDEYEMDSITKDEIALIAHKLQENNTAYDNVIFFIHGRGRHPEKALTQLIPKLEKEYSAAVIMFHWSPSYSGPIGYPDEHAIEAAKDLKKAFNILKEYKNENPRMNDLNPVLLVHSMGNIVLKNYIEKYHENSQELKHLFKNIILNAADVKAKKHSTWLNQLNLSDNIFITTNKEDKILSLSAKRSLSKRLGQKIKDNVALSSNPNVKYLNFDKTGVNHRYYLSKGQNRNKYLKAFYNEVLNGRDINLSSFEGISSIERDKIYVFK